MSDIEIAKLLNVRFNNKTGQVFLEMEVTDPTWRQKILREWQDMEVKLVVEDKKLVVEDKKLVVEDEKFAQAIKDAVDGTAKDLEWLTKKDFSDLKEQIEKWRLK
jgi:hypothetical protein